MSAPASSHTETSLREQTIDQVLSVLVRAAGTPIGREELVERTGLARTTVDKAVQHIAPLLAEKPSRQTPRSDQLSIAPDAGYAIGIEFSHRRILVAVGDIAREIKLWRTARHPVDSEPHTSLDQAANLVTALIAEIGIKPSNVAAVGIASAAPVHPELGTLRALAGGQPAMPGWLGINPIDELRARLRGWNCSFVLGNDADLAALDEFRSASAWWPGPGPLRDLILLKWSSGIGAGLIINGAPLIGSGGLAGEIGHNPVANSLGIEPTGACARCGRVNCLENLGSYDAIRRDLNLGELSRHELEQDARGRQRLELAAQLIGAAIAPLVSALNPQAIRIAGPSPEMHAVLIPAIHTALSEHTIAPALSGLHRQLAESRWTKVEDQAGRLVVASGAITKALEDHASSYLRARLDDRRTASPTPAQGQRPRKPVRGRRRIAT